MVSPERRQQAIIPVPLVLAKPELARWRRRNGLEQAVDHLIDRDALGFRSITDENAVSQGGMHQRAKVIDRHVYAAFKQGPHFAPSTRYCPARVPAPQLTHSLIKLGEPA